MHQVLPDLYKDEYLQSLAGEAQHSCMAPEVIVAHWSDKKALQVDNPSYQGEVSFKP